MMRFPDGMRDQLKAAAEANNRSMNAEIVDRLEQSFEVWPRVSIPAYMAKRGMIAAPPLKAEYERKLDAFAEQLFKRLFPDLDEYISQIDAIFFQAIRDKGAEDEEALRNEYFEFIVPFLRKLGYSRDRPDPNNPDDVPEALWRAKLRGYSAATLGEGQTNPYVSADDRHSAWAEGYGQATAAKADREHD